MSGFGWLSAASFATFALLWLGSVLAVLLDARARLGRTDNATHAVVLAIAVPFVGAFAWLCIRPAYTRIERRERRLVTLIAEQAVTPPPAPGLSVERSPRDARIPAPKPEPAVSG